MKFFPSLVCALALAATAQAAEADYVYRGDIDLGAPGGWDYASVDATSGRVFVGHGETIAVGDAAALKPAGAVQGLKSAHGAVFAPALGVGFATSGGDGSVKVFDLKSLATLASIPVGEDTDSIIFDPNTNTVLVTLGDPKKLAIIDAAKRAVAHLIDLPGEPEFLAADGAGKVYVNLVSSGQIAVVDIASGKIEGIIAMDGCQHPHGLAYDSHLKRLFSGCSNGFLAVVDPKTRAMVTKLAVVPRSDAVAVDEARGRVFVPSGLGQLSIVSAKPGDQYTVIRTLPTFFGARTMAIDPKSGTLFLPYGAVQMVKPTPEAPRAYSFSALKIAVLTPGE